MKKPVVDYTKFTFKKLNNPEYAHLKLLGGWIVYFIFYFITENFIPVEKCHVIHSVVDDLIPFNEWFLIFYCSWYILIVFSLLYFMLYDIDSFKRLQTYIIITQIIAMTVYIIYPSVQDLRPDVFEHDNILTRLMAFIYAFDTPTGVCPSLHVGYSLGIGSVWSKYDTRPVYKILIWILIFFICISTMFVKQHSFIDVIAALPMCLVAELLVYRDRYKLKGVIL